MIHPYRREVQSARLRDSYRFLRDAAIMVTTMTAVVACVAHATRREPVIENHEPTPSESVSGTSNKITKFRDLTIMDGCSVNSPYCARSQGLNTISNYGAYFTTSGVLVTTGNTLIGDTTSDVTLVNQ